MTSTPTNSKLIKTSGKSAIARRFRETGSVAAARSDPD
jgi:hypothetical protein